MGSGWIQILKFIPTPFRPSAIRASALSAGHKAEPTVQTESRPLERLSENLLYARGAWGLLLTPPTERGGKQTGAQEG
jgi:hypothetical protein